MDINNIKNIYYLEGFIDLNGTFVIHPLCKTFIAECKTPNNDDGYSFYSFLTVKDNQNMNPKYITQIIKLENLLSLIENPNIKINRMDEESSMFYKQYFLTIFREQENLKYNLNSDKRILI